ncbi:uncharacterized protein LOC127839055 isoform X1 [Dreissena polymorpha]|nr:uncharacterized protein LOC127839055 isoform X1 [Dreissena polymorpha]
MGMLANRAMSNAAYFCTGILAHDQFFHYGLALDLYTHFTSPIRRYADIIVHRQLLAVVARDGDTLNLPNCTELDNLSQHINKKHRNAQSDSLYEPAGTPTVLFRRQQTLFDIARDIEQPDDQTANQSSAVLNEFIPAVQTAQAILPSCITDTARERLQQLASMCITGPITDPMLLEVRRNHVMKDVLGTIRYSQDDLSKLQIKFIGEAGVDLGGLRCELFSLLVY